MKFALIKRNEDDRFLCTEFSAGTDPYEMTFTPGPYLDKDITWEKIKYCLGSDSSCRLTIFETVEAAKSHIPQLDNRYTYCVVMIADLETIVEENILK